MISSRTFRPQTALGITAVAEFSGPFLFGVVVAKTIGTSIVDWHLLTIDALVACLIGTIFWNLLTWFFGIPSSSSHALIGGLMSAVFISAGSDGIKLQGLYKVLVALFVSPVIGFVFGFIVSRVIHFLARNATPRVNELFRNGQFFTAVGLAFSYGANDAQKTIGIITLSLLISGKLSSFIVPFWVILLSASTMAFGTLLGGWRLIRTLGGKFFRIRPVDGLAAQLTSAVVILGASLVGGPVSTTQVVSSAIMGVGAAERVNKVRWGVAREILTAWLLTIPATALVAAGCFWVINQFIP
jgi:PiT family inorganic phosphate transporter